MMHSPSDLWRLVEKFGYIKIEECIAIRIHNGSKRIALQVSIDNVRHHFETVVTNPLSMLATIDNYRKRRDELRADQVRRQLADEQSKIMANFLQKQRDEIARLHREKLEQEQTRMEQAVKYVRGPIQAILARLKPTRDQFAYLNVYGKPAEVSFH